MNRRLRLLAALLALFAFSAYFAEGVYASLCPPGMDSQSAAAGMTSEHGSQHGHHGALHHSAPSPSDDPGPAGSDAPACPLGMAGAGGSSCVSVSLPAAAGAMSLTAPIPSAAAVHLDTTHDRLLVAAHFRPPRA